MDRNSLDLTQDYLMSNSNELGVRINSIYIEGDGIHAGKYFLVEVARIVDPEDNMECFLSYALKIENQDMYVLGKADGRNKSAILTKTEAIEFIKRYDASCVEVFIPAFLQ